MLYKVTRLSNHWTKRVTIRRAPAMPASNLARPTISSAPEVFVALADGEAVLLAEVDAVEPVAVGVVPPDAGSKVVSDVNAAELPLAFWH